MTEPEELTRRQHQIMALVRMGCTQAQIGAKLEISRHTVKWHLRKIYEALGVVNMVHAAARYSYKLGFLEGAGALNPDIAHAGHVGRIAVEPACDPIAETLIDDAPERAVAVPT